MVAMKNIDHFLYVNHNVVGLHSQNRVLIVKHYDHLKNHNESERF